VVFDDLNIYVWCRIAFDETVDGLVTSFGGPAEPARQRRVPAPAPTVTAGEKRRGRAAAAADRAIETDEDVLIQSPGYIDVV